MDMNFFSTLIFFSPENITNFNNYSETIKPSLYTFTIIKQLLELWEQDYVPFLQGSEGHQISVSHVRPAIKSISPHFPTLLALLQLISISFEEHKDLDYSFKLRALCFCPFWKDSKLHSFSTTVNYHTCLKLLFKRANNIWAQAFKGKHKEGIPTKRMHIQHMEETPV